MIVCECENVSDTRVRETIAKGARTIAEVTRRCGAGGCCRSCHPQIARMLRNAAAARAAEETGNAAPPLAAPAVVG
ncbi:MAG TPA: (2Fe-2S)-binding protein [Candidatus Limnocylindrales bacterium]|nr:(2Fe-2S)-binding protein [Candidatus Limnocylindrales bacterium]